MIYGQCEYCGGVTSAHYKSQLKRFCSHACSNNYKWKSIRPRAVMVEYNCAECGKQIRIKKSDHRVKEGQTLFFCSRQCAFTYKKNNRKEYECPVCGKKFVRMNSRRRYCGEECAKTYQRLLAYRRLYDANISLEDFISLYDKENPFIWASSPARYLRRYNRANKDRLNMQRRLKNHSSELSEYRIYLRASIQACYKKRRIFPHALRKIVGCTLVEFRKHISGGFKEGMNEGNYGEWELDHIIPLSSARTIEELEQLCHFSNYQPLWSSDNRRKSSKILDAAIGAAH